MKVSDLMSPSPACCTPDTTLEAVARMMCEHDCGEIPIVENEAVIGVITDRDITCRAVAKGKNAREMKARDCMSTPAITVRSETSIEECCRIMESRQIRRIPVVDAKNICIGIVAQADLARRASRETTGEVVAQVSRPSAS
jgi:CBS domain-containing protein